MKSCIRCGEEKPEEAFRPRISAAGQRYYAPTCRACHQAVSTEWRRRNPDKVRKYNATVKARNPDYHREKAIENHFVRKFGITIKQRDALLTAQGEVCAICGTDTPKGKGWCVDHNHKTGRVRAILCSPCNVGIGHFSESAERMRRAAIYLEANDVIDFYNHDYTEQA